MEFFEHLVNELMSVSGGNQFLTSTVAVYAMGLITYLMRNVPVAILRFLDRRFIAKMCFDNSSWELRQTQMEFDKWYSNTKYMAAVRDFRLMVTYDGRAVVSPGGSVNFFVLGWRLYWFTTTKDTSERVTQETVYNTTICTLSLWRSDAVFERFVQLFSPTYDLADENSHYWVLWERDGDWFKQYRAKRKEWDDVIYNDKVRSIVGGSVHKFLNNVALYEKLSIPRKLTFLFHGEPGTGKTELTRMIASITGYNVFPMNMEGKNLQAFTRSLNQIPKNSILLLEDVDSFSSKRNLRDYKAGAPTETTGEETSDETGADSGPRQPKEQMTLSGLLNVLDGICPLDNLIVVITTNALEKLDAALYRKSRVDVLLEIERFTSDEIWRYIEGLYPDVRGCRFELLPMAGCEIAELVRKHFDDHSGFLAELYDNYAASDRDFFNQWVANGVNSSPALEPTLPPCQ